MTTVDVLARVTCGCGGKHQVEIPLGEHTFFSVWSICHSRQDSSIPPSDGPWGIGPDLHATCKRFRAKENELLAMCELPLLPA